MNSSGDGMDKYQYYSVTRPILLNGQKRMPSVCYVLPRSMLKSMAELYNKGVVTLYEKRVRFVSGQPIIVETNEPTIVEAPEAGIKDDGDAEAGIKDDGDAEAGIKDDGDAKVGIKDDGDAKVESEESTEPSSSASIEGEFKGTVDAGVS